MARGKQQQSLRLLSRIVVVTSLASLSQVQASAFGRSEFYNAINALEVRGVATPQEPAMLSGFYPRSLNMGISMPMESSWRYTGGGSGPNGGINLGVFRRQTTGDVEAYCDQGKHVCRGLDQVGCCNNNAYCIITEQGEGKCCPLGSVCGEDPCQMTATFCQQVVTVTPTDTATAAEPTTSTSTGCCARACTYTMHLCDLKFGGFCCGNDAVCIPDKMCQATPNPNMPTSTVPISTTTTSELCATGSFACAEAAGGGCCPNNMICTDVSNTPGCALSGSGVKTRQIFTQTDPTESADSIVTDKPSETASITGTGSAGGASSTGADPGASDSPSSSSSPSSELSAGAKAGIGIGAAVAALALIALGVFFLLRHRKNKAAAAASALPPPPPNQPQDPQMAQYAGYAGAPGQQGQYYAGTQYPQGYYPAPQASPVMQPVHGYYDPGEAVKQQAPQEFAGDEAVGGAVMLPNTVAKTTPTAELPAQ